MVEIRELEGGHIDRLLPLLKAYIHEIGEGPLAEDSIRLGYMLARDVG